PPAHPTTSWSHQGIIDTTFRESRGLDIARRRDRCGCADLSCPRSILCWLCRTDGRFLQCGRCRRWRPCGLSGRSSVITQCAPSSPCVQQEVPVCEPRYVTARSASFDATERPARPPKNARNKPQHKRNGRLDCGATTGSGLLLIRR